MSTSDLPQASAPFDAGPLSWVMGEIREALGRSKTALFQAGGRAPEERATALQHAKSHLHQAHGALQMVDIDGVGLLTQAAEVALERFKDGSLECSIDHAQVLAELYQALVEYLEELLAGASPQPLRLFPYYRAVQQMLGVERFHPADLFYPNLQAAVPVPPAPPGAEDGAVAADFPAYRQRYEKALLPFLKSADEAGRLTHAGALSAAVTLVADAQHETRARRFWFVQQTFANLVAGGQLASDLYVKQLFGLINLQMRRLAQGETSLPDAMLRDALFFIAGTGAAADPAASMLRRTWRLDGLVPPDYELKRYGQIDQEALARAREELAQAKAAWDRLAAAEIDPQLDGAFGQSLARVALEADKLKAAPLATLMRQLGEVALAAVKAGRSEELDLEMATALLFAEHGLEQIRRLPDDFSGNAETIGARLKAMVAGETPPAPSSWQGDMTRQIQQDQTVAVLAGEMKAGLRQVEKILDQYDAELGTGTAKPAALTAIDPLLHQVEGALAILDQDDAQRATSQVKDAVQALAMGQDSGHATPSRTLDAIAQNVGALGFFVDMLAHNADAAKARFQFDEAAGTFRAIPFEKIAAAEPVPMLDDELPALPAPPAPPVPAPYVPPADGSDAAIEAELLEIFIGEAQEVLGFVGATLAKPRDNGCAPEDMTMLRRSFHTLKGSGRMVGLNQFANGAAAIERVMNVWLAEERPATGDLFALLDFALAGMDAWVAELAAAGRSSRNADALVAAADRVRDGAPFETDDLPGEGAVAELIAAAPEAPASPPPPSSNGNVIEFPTVAAPAPARDDNLKHVGDLKIGLPLYNIYLAETDELVRLLAQDFGEWRHEAQRPVSNEALHAAHTLTGSSGTVGFKALRDLAHALESAIEAVVAPVASLGEEQHDLLERTLARIRDMLRCFALGELSRAQPELIAELAALREQLATPPAKVPDALDDLEARLNAMFSDVYADIGAHAGAPAGDADAAAPAVAGDGLDTLFASAYGSLSGQPPAASGAATPATSEAPAEKAKLPPPPDTSDIDDLFDSFEPAAQAEAPDAVPDDALRDEVLSDDSSIAAPLDIAPAYGLLPELAGELVSGIAYTDEIDADLLPVFLEEGADLMPQIGQALRAWQADPDDLPQAQLLLRVLHTTKGSARMAGAMRLGQHAHEIETHIENMLHAGSATPHAFEELLTHYDHALQLFEQLQQPGNDAAGVDAAGQQASGDGPPQMAADDVAVAEAAPAARTALVRVRADILDRLVNQAGEVSISRSKLESEVGALRSSLSDFSENLARLRRQLREVEMQAESQIASRMAISSEREFDPLEFDRFTRLQELTRMMAESVNDVASFHENISRGVEHANDDLVLQGRLTRDLQRDLMRVRMVPFASIAERLFRVARQSAKEVDKRVNLDIRGGSVEIDRGVLERMAAPFEHLLRNAIVHGVEARAVRVEAGKNETGELLVQVSQQGNEVVIEFGDDGAGLDLERIRAKAHDTGLLAEDDDADDDRVAALIFEAGFSTAEGLTELAGRGVGMDVVRSEALALGGRVDIASERGKGAHFTIHLPLTLAVTQVVLVTGGGKTHALPAILVEQVQQMKEQALMKAHAEGHVSFLGEQVAFHYLPALLGETGLQPPRQRSCPVMILKNGSERLALQVDEVLGSREVVIKNIGPQLARMAGIAGATVLGSGDIVLILNPVALVHHLEQHPGLRPAYAAVAGGSAAVLAPGQTIMVVDDSLTVRRVTERLLEREGYRVVLAKDGVDALEQLQTLKPALMLVDIEMPRMDGFDLTRNVRDDARTRDIPIIMITSRSADKHRNYALELGVDAYFGKPFQEPVLLAAISGLLQGETATGSASR